MEKIFACGGFMSHFTRQYFQDPIFFFCLETLRLASVDTQGRFNVDKMSYHVVSTLNDVVYLWGQIFLIHIMNFGCKTKVRKNQVKFFYARNLLIFHDQLNYLCM